MAFKTRLMNATQGFEDKKQLCLSPLPRVLGGSLLFLDPDFRLASSERALLLFGFPHTRRESQVKVPIGQPSHTRDGQSVVSRHITPVRRRNGMGCSSFPLS